MKDLSFGADISVDHEYARAIKEKSELIVKELLEKIPLPPDSILVIGCSSSEVIGNNIGKGSSYEVAKIIFNAIYPELKQRGVYLAAQCCEHLNRALIVESELAKKYSLDVVSVIPQAKAGGSFATVAFQSFEKPVVVEHIKAHAGIDIGDTLIGMHLRDVAVPIRLSERHIGEANIVCAYTRPKYIGGERAIYF